MHQEPTGEMIQFFEQRTHAHIERVRKQLRRMATLKTEHANELEQRAIDHDASKFSLEERVPYIWLTEYHRCRKAGKPFNYPNGMTERVEKAIQHHVSTNRHHPEHHTNPNDMTDIDIIEMVCDWTAMSEEFDQDGGSARRWAERTVGARVKFNSERRDFIFHIISLLDANRSGTDES